MPLYPYNCLKCGEETEKIQRVGEKPPLCCGAEMHKNLCAPALKFIGSGFYVNDSKQTEVALEQE